MKNIKRLRLMPVLLCALFLSACSASGGATLLGLPTPSPVPTPTPRPTPAPRIVLCGADDAHAFSEALQSAVEEAGYAFSARAGGLDTLRAGAVSDAACVVLYVADALPEAELPAADCPVLLFSAGAAPLPEGLTGVSYNGADAAKMAIEQAARYEPHVTPVRMLGLFVQSDGAAHETWQTAVSEGVVFDRGTYFSGGETSVQQFLSGALEKLYPGMLDCIFAETGALACEAADALMQLGRTDAEIFCAGTDGDALLRMQSDAQYLACAAGMRYDEAARVTCESAALLIRGESAASRTLYPAVFFASASDDA